MTGPFLLIARIIFLLLVCIVTWLTLTSNPDDVKAGFAVTRWLAEFIFGDAALNDKVAHFTAYGVLGVSAFTARFSFSGAQFWTPVILAAYGAGLEVLQGLGGIRTPELMDGIANMAGATIGFVGMRAADGLLRKMRT